MAVPCEGRATGRRDLRLQRLAALAMGFAYPPRCVVHDCRVSGYWLCPACLDRIVLLTTGRCPCCAGRLRGGRCPACLVHPPQFARVAAVGPYAGVLREAVHALKYRGARGVAGPLARLVAQRVPPIDGAEIVVAVPAHRRRQATRWVDQAPLLAGAIASELGLEVRHDVLVRRHATVPQVGLGLEERRANMAGAFEAGADVRDRPVILVDDVLTTGATAGAATAVLLGAGASIVVVAVVARADEAPRPNSTAPPATL